MRGPAPWRRPTVRSTPTWPRSPSTSPTRTHAMVLRSLELWGQALANFHQARGSHSEHDRAQGRGRSVRRRAGRNDDADDADDVGAEASEVRSQPLAAYVPMGVDSSLQAAEGRCRPRHVKDVDQARLSHRQVAQGTLLVALSCPSWALCCSCRYPSSSATPSTTRSDHTPRFPSISTSTGFWSSA